MTAPDWPTRFLLSSRSRLLFLLEQPADPSTEAESLGLEIVENADFSSSASVLRVMQARSWS